MMTGRLEDLLRLLSEYVPSGAEEAGFRDRMIRFARAHPDPFHREGRDGHFTASAFIVDPPRLRTLLILHGKLGRWMQPGGHIEPADASVLDAALREAREETGLADIQSAGTGIFDLDIHMIPARGAMPAHPHLDVRFLLVANGDAAEPATAEVAARRWVELGDVSALDADASVLRMTRKAQDAFRSA